MTRFTQAETQARAATVLVTDGEQRSALAVVRSLGHAGHRVHVCSARRRCLAGASRFARSQAGVPDPLREPAAFAEAVERLAGACGAEVVLPVSEPALLALLPVRDRLVARIPFVNAISFLRVCDKATVLEEAQRIGVRVPRQTVLTAPAALPIRDLDLGFPLVVKPSRSVVDAGGARAKAGVGYAAGPESLHRILAELAAGAYPVLLQERIVGPGIGVFVLIWEGEVVASFFHRRIREKPPSGGVSVCAESVAPDPALLERSVALLRRFDWKGVAMVEFKLDAATGEPVLMEVNGRFWGSLQLAVNAGVDFPALLVALALGARPPAPAGYRVGRRLRWEWGEVDHLLARLRRSGRTLALPPGSPGRVRATLDFLSAPLRARGEVFRLSDPLPAARESIDWFHG